MTSSHTPVPRCQWFSALAKALDPRSAPRLAILMLAFIATYRLEEFAMGVMTNPFYLDIGFSLKEIAAMNPARIVISPGPCSPAEAGISVAASAVTCCCCRRY